MTAFLRRNWIIPLSVLLGIYIGLPFLAPVLMYFGLRSEANVIYLIYSFMCHQLPERSYFFFGPKLTYSLMEIQNAWKNTINPAILRQFIGNSQMGWKVAWSDRMISMYGGIFIFGLLWWPLKRRNTPLPWWALVLLLMPMAIDGASHFVSDLDGIGQGFRANNLWLVTLTQGRLSASFYTGDAWGSFNSLMRLMTGLLFGMGVVLFGYPYLNIAFSSQVKHSKTILTSQPIKMNDNIHL